jgi:hypothetical protein
MLKATLEGERKGHAIIQEELRSQLRQALAKNSRLEQRLKDEHRVAIMKKQKELEGARKTAELADKELEACRSVIQHMHTKLLGKCFSNIYVF